MSFKSKCYFYRILYSIFLFTYHAKPNKLFWHLFHSSYYYICKEKLGVISYCWITFCKISEGCYKNNHMEWIIPASMPYPISGWVLQWKVGYWERRYIYPVLYKHKHNPECWKPIMLVETKHQTWRSYTGRWVNYFILSSPLRYPHDTSYFCNIMKILYLFCLNPELQSM